MTKPKFNLDDIVALRITAGHNRGPRYNRPMRWLVLGVVDHRCATAEGVVHEFAYHCRGVSESGETSDKLVKLYESELVLSRPFAEEPREPEPMWGGSLAETFIEATQSRAGEKGKLTAAWLAASSSTQKDFARTYRMAIEQALFDAKPEATFDNYDRLVSAWEKTSYEEKQRLLGKVDAQLLRDVVAKTQNTAAALTSAWGNASVEDVRQLIRVHRIELAAELAKLD